MMRSSHPDSDEWGDPAYWEDIMTIEASPEG